MDIPPRPHRDPDNGSLGVTQYPRRPSLSVHPILLLMLIVIIFGIAAFGGLYMLTAKPVILVIEGIRRDVRTHQTTIAGLLHELGVYTEGPDIVTPPEETLITAGLTVTIDKAHPVILEVDGERRRVLTHLIQPRDILAESRISVGLHDVVYADGVALHAGIYEAPPRNLYVMRATPVTINDAGSTRTVFTVARTVGEALHDSKVQLYLADKITPDPTTPLTETSVITIKRSVSLTIQVDGRMLSTRTHGQTIGDALAESGIALIGLDYSIPDEKESVNSSMTIRVVRVTEEDMIERTEIDFPQETRTDSSIPPETQKIIQEGIKGILERRIRVRRENGIEVSRSAPEEVIVRDPRAQIILIGATPALLQPGTPVPSPTGS